MVEVSGTAHGWCLPVWFAGGISLALSPMVNGLVNGNGVGGMGWGGVGWGWVGLGGVGWGIKLIENNGKSSINYETSYNMKILRFSKNKCLFCVIFRKMNCFVGGNRDPRF